MIKMKQSANKGLLFLWVKKKATMLNAAKSTSKDERARMTLATEGCAFRKAFAPSRAWWE